MDKVNECAEANRNRHLHARRYDSQHLNYCVYLKLSGGKHTYKTLKNNNHNGMPSIHGVEKMIKKTRSTITEGVLRHVELVAYIKGLNLPMYVSLSEDATNITGKIDYSPKLNQIVGFVPQLSEVNGMPIPMTFAATSAAAMESIMLDGKFPIANMVNVVMAQPLAMKAKAFCLLVYGGNGKFTKQDVGKRWAYIVKELSNVGIKVLTFSSDSDPRYNGAMRDIIISNKTDESSSFPSWFQFDCSTAEYVPIQDTVHIGTKLRNRLLNRDLKFGRYVVSVEHLIDLMSDVSRDKHGLRKTYIDKTDKMNFVSVQKITDSKVYTLLLQHVKKSAGTALYLKMIDMFLRAFLDMSLTPLERIRNIWYPTFVFRIWKEFISRNPDQKDTDFITSYTYTCIEINAHSVITLILYLREHKLEHLFLPHMMSSQPCESFFRQFRSLLTTGTTVTNTSVLGMIRRCERIALLNEISVKLKDYIFETDSKRLREIYYKTNGDGYNRTSVLPNREEIFEEIERAKEDAIHDAAELGMVLEEPFACKCDIKPAKNKEKDQSMLNTAPRQDGNKLTQFHGVHLQDYSNQMDLTKFNQTSPYVLIEDMNINNTAERLIYVRKSALVDLYMQNCTKLSSDRIHRVKQRAPPKLNNISQHAQNLQILAEPILDEDENDLSDTSFNPELYEEPECTSDEEIGYASSEVSEYSSDESSDIDIGNCFNLLGMFHCYV